LSLIRPLVFDRVRKTALMTSLSSDSRINSVLISLSRSFLQYVSESWMWVDESAKAIGEQVSVLGVRQRQDVADLARLLQNREWSIDFGAYPTEYTDMQFLSLSALFSQLMFAQSVIDEKLTAAVSDLRGLGDTEAAEWLEVIRLRECDLAGALKEIQQDLKTATATA